MRRKYEGLAWASLDRAGLTKSVALNALYATRGHAMDEVVRRDAERVHA